MSKTMKPLPSSPSLALTAAAIRADVATAMLFIKKKEHDRVLDWVIQHPHIANRAIHKDDAWQQIPVGTPLFHAAIETGNLAVVRAFTLAGAPLESRCKQGRTPLLCAAAMTWTEEADEIVNYLISKGCNLSAKDKSNHNILSLSNYDCKSEIFEKAFKAGISPDELVTPDRVPMIRDFFAVGRYEFNEKTRQILKDFAAWGLNVNPPAVDVFGLPLASMLTAERLDLLDVMLESGFDPLHRSQDGQSLAFAVRSVECFSWLMSIAPELMDAPDHQGMTPLMNALHGFRGLGEEQAEFFISAGANLDVFDHQGPGMGKSPRQMIMSKPKSRLANVVHSLEAASAARAALKEIACEIPEFFRASTHQIRR